MNVISAKFSENMKSFGKHYHDAHQMIYVKEGRIRVRIENEEYEAGSGSLVILSRFEEHSIDVLTPQYKRYSVVISPETTTSDIDEYILSTILTNRFEGFSHVVDLVGNREIKCFFEEMALEFSKKAACS